MTTIVGRVPPSATNAGRFVRRYVALAIVCAIATACSGGGSSGTPASTTAPSTTAAAATGSPTTTSPTPSAETENTRIRRLLHDKGPDVELARQLFVLEVAPLPGVAKPSGRADSGESGTYAALQLLAVWDQLTQQQRDAAGPLVGMAPAPDLATAPSFGAPPTAFPPLPTRGSVKTIGTAGVDWVDRPALGPVTPDARYLLSDTDLLRAYFKPMFDWANQAIAALTGAPALTDAFDLDFFNDPNDAWAWTTDFYSVKIGSDVREFGRRANCHTSINVAKFSNRSFDVQTSVVTHEVFHCYQQHQVASLSDSTSIGGWLHDGEATWVQNAIVTTATFDSMQQHWNTYIFSPKKHLFDRDYDALGFFGHLSDVSSITLVAKKLLSAFAAGVGRADENAFATAVGELEDSAFDSWASSYFLAHHQQKMIWDMRGPGSTANIPGTGASPETVSVNAGVSSALPKAAQWELSLARLESGADMIEFTADSGHVALIDQSETISYAVINSEPIRFCLRDKCVCPPGSTGNVPSSIPAKAPFDVGLTGGRHGASAHAQGFSLDDYCTKPPQPPSSGGGGNGSPAGSTGTDPQRDGSEPPYGKATSDPHLATLDGRWYDLHAKGEFTLSRSTTDDFVVQVRFANKGGNRTFTTTSAMATKVGTDRVTVSMLLESAEPTPVLRINGALVEANSVVLDGAVVRAVRTTFGSGYVITFRDGTRVGANSTAREGMSVWVDPSTARRGKLTGLLGDGDGDKTNDPVVRGGALLADKPTYDDLYAAFAASWRLTQNESLLDYAAGETTTSFTDLTMPDRDTPAATPAALATAETACKSGGVVDADLLRNCAFDVAVTGNKNFADTYHSQQGRIDYVRTFKGDGTVPAAPAASGTTKANVFEGTIATSNDQPALPFTGGKGDIIYIDPANCVVLRFSRIDDPSGKALSTALGCGDRYVLPADGQYSIKINIFKDATGAYRIPLRPVRADLVRPIAIGGVMTGTIAFRAEHDVFTLAITSPTKVAIGGADCSAPNFSVSLYFGTELVTAGDACRLGTIDLPQSGTYRFELNTFNSTTGDYRIPISKA